MLSCVCIQVLACDTTSSVAGVWKLMEAVTLHPDGRREAPYGEAPGGLFVYSPGGYLSLHLNRMPAPERWIERPDEAAWAAAARAYIGYHGRWSQDFEKGVIVHYIDGALNPNRYGSRAERPYVLCGDNLELRITASDGREFIRRLSRLESFANIVGE